MPRPSLTLQRAIIARENEAMNETLKTYRNTKSMVWWPLVNKELARLGLREANFEEVRGYYELGYDPQTAAADLAVVRS